MKLLLPQEASGCAPSPCWRGSSIAASPESTVCIEMCIYIYAYCVWVCMCMSVYIHIYIYNYSCVHTCTYAYLYIFYMHAHTHMHIYAYIRMHHPYIHTHIRTSIHTYTYTYIHTYIHTCMHTYTHRHACFHACIHTYTCIFLYISIHVDNFRTMTSATQNHPDYFLGACLFLCFFGIWRIEAPCPAVGLRVLQAALLFRVRYM